MQRFGIFLVNARLLFRGFVGRCATLKLATRTHMVGHKFAAGLELVDGLPRSSGRVPGNLLHSLAGCLSEL